MTAVVAVIVEPLLVRPEVARQMVGGRTVLEAMEAAGWVAPSHRRHKLTLYAVSALRAAAARLQAEELPGQQLDV